MTILRLLVLSVLLSNCLNSHSPLFVFNCEEQRPYSCLFLPFSRDDYDFKHCNTSNVSSTLRSILNCGDVNPHPGPSVNARRCRFPCVTCGKGVTKASKAVSCDECDRWVHARCANVSPTTYQQLLNGEISLNHVCNICSFAHMPFSEGFETEFGETVDDGVANPPKDFNWEIPSKINKKGLLFLHLNARSLLPKLGEVKLLLHQHD